MRRFWQPVAISDEVKDFPIRVKVLGEELVLFRDPQGELGLLGLHCPHRLASLEYGDIESRGLRCRYHGWLYAKDGSCLEQPAEPPESNFKDKVKHLSYPVEEFGGLVLAYMGPPEKMPALPKYDVLAKKGSRHISRREAPSNYLQIWENGAVDPWHTYFVHKRAPIWSWKRIAKIEWSKIDNGQYAGIDTKAIREDALPGKDYVRQVCAVMPSAWKIALRGEAPVEKTDFNVPPFEKFLWLVPMDDDNTMHFTIDYMPAGYEEQFSTWQQLWNVKFDWPLPRDTRGKVIMDSVPNEDGAVVFSQGSITPRQNEHLGTTDKGVILLRNLIREGVELVMQGKDPPGVLSRDQASDKLEIPAMDELLIKAGARSTAR